MKKRAPLPEKTQPNHMDMASEIGTGRVYLLTWWTVTGRIVSSYQKKKKKKKETELLIP